VVNRHDCVQRRFQDARLARVTLAQLGRAHLDLRNDLAVQLFGG
jgi:hypothetical protein